MAGIEGRLQALFGYEHAVIVGRARAGLAAVLDEVALPGAPLVMPSNLCTAVFSAAVAAGARPTLAPVSPLTGVADEAALFAAAAACARPGVLMPVHGYGFWSSTSELRARASASGWFVLENDSLAAATVRDGRRQASGDALLVSFGAGKSIGAAAGGAVLTDDGALAGALRRRVASWPDYDVTVERTETDLVIARRHLLALGHAELGEGLLDRDVASTRHAFPAGGHDALAAALDALPGRLAARAERLARWMLRLAPLTPEIAIPDVEVRAPWRAVVRVERPGLRDRVVSALRSAGFDAGTNYPPLTTHFPKGLAGQGHVDAEAWGDRVLTLWLEPAYDDARIDAAVAVIERAIETALKAEVAG